MFESEAESLNLLVVSIGSPIIGNDFQNASLMFSNPAPAKRQLISVKDFALLRSQKLNKRLAIFTRSKREELMNEVKRSKRNFLCKFF